jgi:PAS domain S-box-containing protein
MKEHPDDIIVKQADGFPITIQRRCDKLMDYFLLNYFVAGLFFAYLYHTWLIAIGVGGTCLMTYYCIKIALPNSRLYQYVLSAILGVFMAQFIYQMHGLSEMYFFAFIGSALLITYQKWQLQIPLLIVVIIYHTVFSYLQNAGYGKIYFRQPGYFSLQEFLIHILLTIAVFFICGLWAYQLKRYNQLRISQTIQMDQLKKDAQLVIEKKQTEKALEERNTILESIGDAFFATDKNWVVTYWNNSAEKIFNIPRVEILGKSLWLIFEDPVNTPFYSTIRKSVEENMAKHFESWYEKQNAWHDVNVYPSENGLSVFIKDITERKNSEFQMNQLNLNLQLQAKELAISNAELEQFAYVASHDLQEPLRMITGFLTQFEKKYGGTIDDTGRKYIGFAVDGSKKMRQIIHDLLDFSRAGRTEDKIEKVDLQEIVKDIRAIYSRQILEGKITINSDNLPALHTFKAPIRQVFQNLVGNGIKYQKPDQLTVIDICHVERDKYWEFSVKDNGIGINEEFFDKIFIIFKRLHDTEAYPGTGMGLAVTKKIIENMGGKIWVESEEGSGSTFYFTVLK